MQVHLTLRARGLPDRDVAIDAPPGAALGALRDLDPTWSPEHAGWWSGTRRLGADAAIGGPGLRDGDIIGVGQVGPRDATAGAVLMVHAIGGPDSGGVWGLPSGPFVVGRADDADVRLVDGDVSRRHASLTIASSGILLQDLDSTNGTAVDGTPIGADGADIRPGQLVQLGSTVLCLAGASDAPAALRPHLDGTLLMNRPPRPPNEQAPAAVEFPVEPRARLRSSPRIVASLAPAVVGATMAFVMHSPVYLLFAVLSPVAVLGNWIGDRVGARRGRCRASRAFRRAETAAEATRDSLLRAEASQRRGAHPDPATVRLLARRPTSRLWERRPADTDFLDVRVGLGDAPARVRLERGHTAMPAPTLALVPRWANLREGPLGICGAGTATLAAARWAVLQLAALHSTADLRVVALLSDAQRNEWHWLRWLPHTQSIAADASSRKALVEALRDRATTSVSAQAAGSEASRTPWTVVLVDSAAELAEMPGLAQLLDGGSRSRTTAICVADSTRRLPTACASVLELDATATHASLRTPAGAEQPDILLDRMAPEHAEDAARGLAALRDPADEQSAVPPSVRMTEALGPGAFAPDWFTRRWAASDGSPRTVIGIGARGPYELDLVRDGPHALIAGTTGSGKSELLQSLIAGLAAACSPQDLGFVLIDYKGGAAFAQCAALPHTAGLVTDLDQQLAERALRSLHAELRRREAILAAAGAADLAAYRRSRTTQDERLPRIVLVVDEFAALAEELPTFVGGLVGVAQRGRSLGVHLVLATQRPGGVVSPEIRANANLRIALRVTDPAESRDVIGIDDATRLPRSRPGRALLRIGTSSEPAIELQTMHAAAPSRARGEVTVRWLDGWRSGAADLAQSGPPSTGSEGRHSAGGSADATSGTELAELVRGARAAAHGAPPPRAPWLAPLSERLTLDQLASVEHEHELDADAATRAGDSVLLGIVDLPDEQKQQPLRVRLTGGTTLIVGAAGSGRTSALRLIAHQASADRACEIHALDCGSEQLGALEESPRCGVFADGADADALRTALARLVDMVSARRIHRPSHACVVLIDGIDTAMSALDASDPGRGPDQLLSMLRDAPSGGVTVFATADRPALASRLASTFATKLVLRLNDRGDYTLAGIPSRLVPTELPAGRGMVAPSGDILQIAVLDPDPAEQNRSLRDALAPPRDPGASPMTRLRALPRRVELRSLATAGPLVPGDVILGVGGDDSHTVVQRLLEPRPARLVIAGPPGSGRSSTLALIADQLGASGISTLLVADVRRWRHPLPPAASVLDAAADPPDDPASIGDPRVILIDDCQGLDSVGLGAWLADVATRRPDIAFVGAGRADELAASFRGVGMVLARERRGVLLCPSPTDPDLFALRLPRTRAPFAPGRGLVVGADGAMPIQVALRD